MPAFYKKCPLTDLAGGPLHRLNRVASQFVGVMGTSLDGDVVREVAASTGEPVLNVLRRMGWAAKAWEAEARRADAARRKAKGNT